MNGLDLDALDAIDVHAHVEVDGHGHMSLPEEFVEASSRYFAADRRAPGLDEIAEYYRERRTAVVVFTVDIESANGHAALSNEEIADAAARHPDIMIPFASVDPAKGRAGARRFRALVQDHGMRGIKFHPSIQGFAPNDRSAYPLLEVAQELGVPALFHTGQTGIGAGLPGGGGIRLSLSNPMLLDDVAVEFPDLTIIMAHPSFPWQDEALAVATHKPKVYIDLSGWSPKYFPPQLVQWTDLLDVTGATTKVDYGLNKVRFPSPVPAGAAIRAVGALAKVDQVAGGGIELTGEVTIEIKDSDKPRLRRPAGLPLLPLTV